MKEYYTVKEFAEYFSISTKTVEAWIYRGKLKFIKLGRSTRIPRSEVERFVKGE